MSTIITRRFLSGVSELDRSKYFNIHSTSDDDKDVGKFLADYQVGLGRSSGDHTRMRITRRMR